MSALVSKSIKCVSDLFFWARFKRTRTLYGMSTWCRINRVPLCLTLHFCYFHRKAEMIRASKRTKQRILLRDSFVHDQLNTTSLVNESRMSTLTVIGAEFKLSNENTAPSNFYFFDRSKGFIHAHNRVFKNSTTLSEAMVLTFTTWSIN